MYLNFILYNLQVTKKYFLFIKMWFRIGYSAAL